VTGNVSFQKVAPATSGEEATVKGAGSKKIAIYGELATCWFRF